MVSTPSLPLLPGLLLAELLVDFMIRNCEEKPLKKQHKKCKYKHTINAVS